MLKLKTKECRLLLAALVIFSMLTVYGSVPVATAAITSASDTISDSDVSASNVTHTFTFTIGSPLVNTDDIDITFPAGFSNILVGNVTCPASTTAAVSDQVVTCDVTDSINAGTALTVIVGTTTNPSTADDYTINIRTENVSETLIESADVMVYILDDVTMSASVPATLTFGISGLDVGADVNGVTTTATSTATTTPFGTLSTAASSTVGQRLTVSTNADDGFTVTVFQSGNLSNAGGADIDSFKDGAVPGSPEAWAAPTGNISDEATWGHMGLTSADATMSGGTNPFGNALFTGFNDTSPVAVMYHDGPTNGTGEGVAEVAYSTQISSIQEAGDYSTTLTYICTPQY